MTHGSELITVIAAISLGMIFTLVAVFLESVAIGLAGFLGGGYAVMGLAGLLGIRQGAAPTIAFIVGGLVGIALIVVLFNWALITISSLAGASMIVGGLALTPNSSAIVYAGLVLIGVIFQGMALRGGKSGRDEPSA